MVRIMERKRRKEVMEHVRKLNEEMERKRQLQIEQQQCERERQKTTPPKTTVTQES